MTTCSCSHEDDEHESTPSGFGACTVSVAELFTDSNGAVGRLIYDCPCFLFEHDPRFDGEPS